MTESEIIEKLLKSIDIISSKRAGSIGYTYYMEGRVSAINNTTGKHTVLINEESEILPSRTGLSLAVDDNVLICVPNGNQSFKFIDTKKLY